MAFTYKSILVLGATSGIGYALSEKFLAEGKKVIVVGRRKDRLDEFVAKYRKQYGEDKVASYVFDITKLDEIAEWATKVTKEHPDLDAVFINSGIQRGFNFSKPESVDLELIKTELTTNYTSYVFITHAFLPFLLAKHSALVFNSSVLAIVPLARCPNYCASKAALHHFLLSLRVHLKDTSIQIMEIIPPAVQTELHDKVFQPDIKNGRELGMPLKDFVEETYQALMEGNDSGEYPIGHAKGWYAKIEPGRREVFEMLPQMPASV